MVNNMSRIIATFEIDLPDIKNEEIEDALSDIHQDMNLISWGTI